jgi:hypothetical protein
LHYRSDPRRPILSRFWDYAHPLAQKFVWMIVLGDEQTKSPKGSDLWPKIFISSPDALDDDDTKPMKQRI